MNSAWQTFLCNHRAVIENNRVIHFGNSATELQDTRTATVITDLSHYSLLRFSGEDTKTFLQSQLTCDIREINPHRAQYGSYCTPKGRILATFLLWQQGNDFLMQLPTSLAAAIQKRLSMYVLRAKVTLTDASDDWIRIGIAGPHAAALTDTITGTSSGFNQSLQVMHEKEISILYLSQQHIELITTPGNAPELWNRLNQHATAAGAGCWDWLTITTGIPVILPETQEIFLPQMINLDAVGGVSFKKGCYPGQEIVARTQYLGKLKRRMFLAHIDTVQTITAGDALYSSDMADQSSGNIVNAALSPHGGFDVLAVIQQSSVDACRIHWQSLQGPTLEISPLPYPLPD